jgi:MarR family transcriptional regulator, organic hydroperoxide resistance regulator
MSHAHELLCFAVYSADLAFRRAYKPILGEFGITYSQWMTILALREENNQTVCDLGEKLFLESNTLTPLLKTLEKAGYVSRRRDSADERRVLVSLTDASRRLRETGAQRTLIEAVGLWPEEFQKSIVRLRTNLTKHSKAEA